LRTPFWLDGRAKARGLLSMRIPFWGRAGHISRSKMRVPRGRFGAYHFNETRAARSSNGLESRPGRAAARAGNSYGRPKILHSLNLSHVYRLLFAGPNRKDSEPTKGPDGRTMRLRFQSFCAIELFLLLPIKNQNQNQNPNASLGARDHISKNSGNQK